MSVVTTTGAWPRHGEPFTVSDLDRMPDDGHRYELLDGTLIVSPVPGTAHQRVAIVLGHVLELACPEELIVFPNVGVRIGSRSALEPDVVVARSADVTGIRLDQPPLLVVEILSPDSVLRDLNLKKAAYERFGIPSYWVVDPDLAQPSLRAFQLVDGGYCQEAHVVGDVPFRAEQPFPVEVVPAHLVAKLRTG
jgi:Uma2 family endonuclease